MNKSTTINTNTYVNKKEATLEYSNGSHKNAKKNLKDSLFTFLFRDIKYLRQLYASLYDDEAQYSDEDFHLITLENILVNNV